MSVRSVSNRVISAATLLAAIALVCNAQINAPARANSASHVAVEMIDGKLNPTDSKRGNTVAIRLNEDVRSSGEVIFKKGTTITGVITSVSSAEKGDWKSGAQSVIDIEWQVPAPQGRGVQGVSFTLQSIIQSNAGSEHRQTGSSDDFSFMRAVVPNSPTAVNGRSNIALLSMPSVVA